MSSCSAKGVTCYVRVDPKTKEVVYAEIDFVPTWALVFHLIWNGLTRDFVRISWRDTEKEEG